MIGEAIKQIKINHKHTKRTVCIADGAWLSIESVMLKHVATMIYTHQYCTEIFTYETDIKKSSKMEYS